MSLERQIQTPSKFEELLDTAKRSPETFGDLEASMLFLGANFSDFKRFMIELGKTGRTFSLVFVMDDMGETDVEKKMRLRQLKAIREDQKLSRIITRITVNGRPGEQSVEPNVFSSNVMFVPIEE